MIRQIILFTEPNDEWLNEQLKNEKYSSKSELVNDLVGKARKQQAEINWLRLKLDRAEKDGFTTHSRGEILAIAKSPK